MESITGLGILNSPLLQDSSVMASSFEPTNSSSSSEVSAPKTPSTPSPVSRPPSTPYSPLFGQTSNPFSESERPSSSLTTRTSYSTQSPKQQKPKRPSRHHSASSSVGDLLVEGDSHGEESELDLPDTPLMTNEPSSEDDDESNDQVPSMPSSSAFPSHTPSSARRPSSPLAPSPETPGSPSLDNDRIHARNLSLFFPQPLTGPVHAPSSSTASISYSEEQVLDAPITDISGSKFRLGRPPRLTGGSVGEEGLKGFKFGSKRTEREGGFPPPSPRGAATSIEGAVSPGKMGRRGHHHKHSLSHNFFSFLDPTVTSQSLLPPSPSSATFPRPPSTPTSALHSTPLATPKPVPTTFILSNPPMSPSLPSPSQSTRRKSLLQTLTSLPPQTQLAAGFGVLEFFIGTSLWVDGQAGGSVGVTGLGYLVVWDAIGVGLGVAGKMLKGGAGGFSSLRRPFGSLRMESLLYFVQSIFLLFASVYVAKESLEHVLLSGHDHHDDFYELEFPLTLLLWAVLCGTFAGVGLGNHRVLVDAVGPVLVGVNGPKKLRSDGWQIVERVDGFLANPFSLVVVLCSALALIGGVLLPQEQLVNLDKCLAVIETITTFWIAYPTSLAFAQVLLQTAPPERSSQMIAFQQAVLEVEMHPSVVRVDAPHVWQLTPHQPKLLPPQTPAGSRAGSAANSPMGSPVIPEFKDFSKFFPQTPPQKHRQPSNTFGSPLLSARAFNKPKEDNCILVATLTVYVLKEADDREVLDVTRYAYERCAGAIGMGGGKGKVGENSGELSVMVKRLVERPEKHDHAHDHAHDHCEHDHGHDHGKEKGKGKGKGKGKEKEKGHKHDHGHDHGEHDHVAHDHKKEHEQKEPAHEHAHSNGDGKGHTHSHGGHKHKHNSSCGHGH